jgi:hypothetical protein
MAGRRAKPGQRDPVAHRRVPEQLEELEPELDDQLLAEIEREEEAIRQLRATLAVEGWTATSAAGTLKPHPAARLLSERESQLARLRRRGRSETRPISDRRLEILRRQSVGALIATTVSRGRLEDTRLQGWFERRMRSWTCCRASSTKRRRDVLLCGKRYTRQKGMGQRRRIAGNSGRSALYRHPEHVV